MKRYSGAINPQNVYEACIPYTLDYPYRIIKKDKVEIGFELFSDKSKAREIEIATKYKPRPVIIISCSEVDNSYLAVSITKIKEKIDKDFLLAICNNQIKERHPLFLKKYPNVLNSNSLVRVDSIYKVTRNNIFNRRGRLYNEDYIAVCAKLKDILF